MKNPVKEYRVILTGQLAIMGLSFSYPEVTKQAWLNSFHFMTDILMILPPVLLLVGLLDAWAPVGAIETHLGRDSGVQGMCLALAMGSVAAGPLFAAFPIVASFASKGGRIANAIIFLGAWATIKIPMLMMESQFIGVKFSLLRLVLTIPSIILIGLLMEAFLEKRRTDS